MNQLQCKGCTNRRYGCHSVCESYIAFKKEREEINKAKERDRIYKGYIANRYKHAKGWA